MTDFGKLKHSLEEKIDKDIIRWYEFINNLIGTIFLGGIISLVTYVDWENYFYSNRIIKIFGFHLKIEDEKIKILYLTIIILLSIFIFYRKNQKHFPFPTILKFLNSYFTYYSLIKIIRCKNKIYNWDKFTFLYEDIKNSFLKSYHFKPYLTFSISFFIISLFAWYYKDIPDQLHHITFVYFFSVGIIILVYLFITFMEKFPSIFIILIKKFFIFYASAYLLLFLLVIFFKILTLKFFLLILVIAIAVFGMLRDYICTILTLKLININQKIYTEVSKEVRNA